MTNYAGVSHLFTYVNSLSLSQSPLNHIFPHSFHACGYVSRCCGFCFATKHLCHSLSMKNGCVCGTDRTGLFVAPSLNCPDITAWANIVKGNPDRLKSQLIWQHLQFLIPLNQKSWFIPQGQELPNCELKLTSGSRNSQSRLGYVHQWLNKMLLVVGHYCPITILATSLDIRKLGSL